LEPLLPEVGHERVKCSFVVSAFDRPLHLACLLRSLQVQSEPDFEVLVTDNSTDFHNQAIVQEMNDPRFCYFNTRLPDCYLSANYGASMATGEYLSFPSDDGYYGPRFLQTMLAGWDADLIYCDCIYDGHGIHYAPMDVAPVSGQIDKGGFLLKREKFTGFAGPAGLDRAADAWLIEALIKTGATHTKAPGYLWMHN
jgi:glycosyltransferase involved in cell wall biosynthesis